MRYEFYIYTDNGNNTWHRDLKEWRHVKDDIKHSFINHPDDKSISVEIQRWYGEGDFDYVEIYPENKSKELPKYVQKFVQKVLS